MKKLLRLSAFLFALLLSAQSSPLNLAEIMKGEEFVGYSPENPVWGFDNETLYFDWNPKNELGKTMHYWKKGMKEPLPASLEDEQFYSSRFQTKDFQTYYYVSGGALWSYDSKSKKKKRLFQNAAPLSNLQLGKTPGVLFFEQNGNSFKLSSSEGSLVQITNFSKAKTEEKPKAKDSFLASQQKELFEYIQDQNERKKWREQRSKLLKKTLPKSFGTGKDFFNLSVNPNEKYVTFVEGTRAKNQNEVMAVFITEDGYNESRPTKQKVSQKNLFPSRLGIYSVERDSAYFVEFKTLTGLSIEPEYLRQTTSSAKAESKSKKEPRELSFGRTLYSDDGSYAVVDIRSQDNKDRWLVSLNLKDGSFEEIDHQHDEAWIGGPGIPSYSFGTGNIGFLEDLSTLYYQSEKTGYSHLYTYNLKSKERKTLTSGNWEVREAQLSKDKKTFYLSTNTTHPGNREFYKLSTSGGKLSPLLTQNGDHEVVLSPDEKKVAVRYSYKNKPWELYVADNSSNPKLQPITHSTTKEFNSYSWKEPQVLSFNAQDGQEIYARIYKPKAEVKNSAAVIFVHGAGYLQNAHNWWSSYFREYMFHNLLTDLGYTVLDIDYRASDGYGRDVRTGIYRFMGGKDLSDHLDAKKLLVEKYGIEPSKVGIYGGSYGGFITLMALLTEPGEFKAGAALRSVTDWAHYNHGYTGNILNFPETDPEAYKKSSPIYYADNLQDHLLMLHGVVDNNVEYKDIVRLQQRFIELGKTNWNLASYPVEAHGFRETSSWTDEYRRILEHFNTYLLEK
ncbi:alpha/beta hydrolase family protein [Chryseobacterium sp. A321]